MKNKAGTLLAVVTLATAVPAAANPTHVAPAKDPWAHVANHPMPQHPTVQNMQAEALVSGLLAVFGVTIPRTLPSGAPACGNVQAKMSPAQQAACEAKRTETH